MNSSDIIAIVAIVISAIVSIVSAYISFQNNKANINAKRSEIALERRLDAFSEVTTKIGLFRLSLTKFLGSHLNQKFEKNDFKDLSDIFIRDLEDFHMTVEKYQVYLPKHISVAVDKFSNVLEIYSNKVIERKDIDSLTELFDMLWKEEQKIVDLMQDFIGLK